MRDYRLGRLKGRYVIMWDDDDGTRRRYRLPPDTTAKDVHRKARDLIRQYQPAPEKITVAEIWEAYRKEMGTRRQAGKLVDAGRNVLPVLGHLAAIQITPEDCRRYIAQRRKHGRKDATIRTELSCLRTALSWAHKNRLIPVQPHTELPPTPPPRERYLNRDEVEALLEAAGEPHIRLAMLLMLTTAARVGALLELTWDRVDLERRVIKLATNDIGPKKGRATVPINDTLVTALTSAREAALSPFVIEWAGRQVGSIKTGFNAARERAGIDHCTPHDLRRTAGRFMAEAGVPIDEIATYLGHTNPNITRKTYAQYSPDYLRKAASALEFGRHLVQ